ncbi:response regulator [Aliirhizobium terrae]|uniref:response regulator n=1 Tax=Terrirhizobium terrae TaxID=2926709 RepID=UPI002577022D|nr:response regulator [Rhizobium sp. CC-CFT758]WJH40493.1 response regulator [Rhizobium sp. CC-CFT758]
MGQSTPIAKPVVLVVEDEPLQRMMAVDLVLDAGFDVVEAWSADEAVTILESRSDIRVVFTDVDMPGSMDGLKLAAAIRDRWPPIEIIVTSGHMRMTENVLPDRSVFFSKPYDTERVTAEMTRMVSAG